jgi:hypothetical protein
MFSKTVSWCVAILLFSSLWAVTACTPAPECRDAAGCKDGKVCEAGKCVDAKKTDGPSEKLTPDEANKPDAREIPKEPTKEVPPEPRKEKQQEPDTTSDAGEPVPEEKIVEVKPEPRPEKPVLKELGMDCSKDSDCKSGSCQEPGRHKQKICTKSCMTDKDCSSGSKCAGPRGYKGHCLPTCTIDSDCAGLNNDLKYCWNEGYCWKKKDFGATCKTNRECGTGYICNDPGYLGARACTKVCKTNADCAKEKGICELHDPSKPGYCVPPCKTNADCKFYGKMQVCNTELHCWLAYQKMGTQCQDNAECAQYPLCTDPGGLTFKLCTMPCTADKDCGSGNYCYKQKPTSKGYCLIGCTKASDCDDAQAYSTPVCKNKTYCWKIE